MFVSISKLAIPVVVASIFVGSLSRAEGKQVSSWRSGLGQRLSAKASENMSRAAWSVAYALWRAAIVDKVRFP